jgi:hypothetical protein
MNLRRWTIGIRSSTVLSATVAIALTLFVGALILRTQLQDSLYSSISDQALTRATGVAQLVATGDFESTLQSTGASRLGSGNRSAGSSRCFNREHCRYEGTVRTSAETYPTNGPFVGWIVD